MKSQRKNSVSRAAIFAAVVSVSLFGFSAQAKNKSNKSAQEPVRNEQQAHSDCRCASYHGCPCGCNMQYSGCCNHGGQGRDYRGCIPPQPAPDRLPAGEMNGPDGRGGCPQNGFNRGPQKQCPQDSARRAEYREAFGNMRNFDKLSEKEKKEILAKQKAFFDKRDAERKAAMEKKKEEKKQFDEKWAKFDKLTVEEQEQLIKARMEKNNSRR